jgi:RND family efflux transporter MFP subunit
MPASFRAFAALYFLSLAATAVAEAPVRTETAATRDIVRQVNVTGTVTSPRSALLSTAVAGLVAELVVDEGSRVVAGEPLLRLDAELAELELERALAEVQQQETALADARRRLSEAEKIGTERGIARTEIESRRAEVASDEAALAALLATARVQQAIVERHTLRAPFPGVISQRFADPGEWVNPGTGLLELVATENLRFDFQIAQDLSGAVTPATPVEVSVDALPGISLSGRIQTIVPVKSTGARTFLVRVLADDHAATDSFTITPGMSARGRLVIDAGRRSVVVPRDAILRFPDGRMTVWVIDNSGEVPVVREQVVQTGFEFDGLVEIRTGLADGDIVVVRGNEALQEGQPVTLLDRN